MHSTLRLATALACVLTTGACGGSGNPAGPSSPDQGVLTATMTVRAERLTAGYRYVIVVRFQEVGGAPVTVGTADMIFFVDGATYGTDRFENILATSATHRIPANGTGTSRELVSDDPNAAAPFASRVQANVAYTDGRQRRATVSAAADIPALATR